MIPETIEETTEGGLRIRDLLAVLEPVLDWYQSDEHPEREPLEILRDIVADLQTDRAAALIVGSAATDALALCHQIEKCGCSPELTEASIMASRLRAKLSSANEMDTPKQGRPGGCAPTAGSAVLVRRLLGNAPRVVYWKVYVAGEALHEDHDKQEWAEEQAARLRAKLSKQIA